MFTPLKNNIGDDKTGYAYAIEGVALDGGIQRTSRVTLDPTPIRITPEEALAAGGDNAEDAAGAVAEVANFLRTEIGDTGRLVTELKTAAKGAGLGWRTVERAEKATGVIAQKGRLQRRMALVHCPTEDRQRRRRPPKRPLANGRGNWRSLATIGGNRTKTARKSRPKMLAVLAVSCRKVWRPSMTLRRAAMTIPKPSSWRPASAGCASGSTATTSCIAVCAALSMPS